MENTALLKVDFSEKIGTIRRLNGGNLGPQLYGGSVEASLIGRSTQLEQFKSLEIPAVRLHDVPLGNYGLRLVDIQHIFGNWKADEQNPDNYYFTQTDDYIRQLIEADCEVIYRLGTSIEHTANHYYTSPPENYDKWVDICINIIRHYNEGWHNGFGWNIKYWEIWNEPDIGPFMWSGTAVEYYDLYVLAAKKIKARFPNVKVGGPALAYFNDGRTIKDWPLQFLDYCRKTNAPLDFFSWHYYPKDTESILETPQMVRDVLDSYGFFETELHFNEWHYLHETSGWDKTYIATGPYRLGSMRSAAHLVAVLTGWQDTPLTMGCFYTLGYLPWGGTFGVWEHTGKANKNFYGFKAFAEMAHYHNRVRATSNAKDVRLLAGINDAGEGALLISDFKTSSEKILVEFDEMNASTAKILVLDEERDLEPICPVIENNRIILETPKNESIVYLIKGLR